MTPTIQLTSEQAKVAKALMALRNPYKFAKALGVRLNPAQRRWFSLVGTNPDGWTWRLKLVMHVAANQIGKTLGLAVLVMWACWCKIGISTSDPARWMSAPYTWFHLAPKQQQAYILLGDMKLLMAGDHPAQVDPMLLPTGLIVNARIEDYYDGLEFWNGALVQFRTTDDKAKALQGRRAAGISYDEAAFEDHLKSVVNEVLMMRLIASGGPLWLVSTPNGINDWYEFVVACRDAAKEANPPDVAVEGHPLLGGSAQVGADSDGTPHVIPVWVDPASASGLVWSTVEDNVGFGLTREGVDRMEETIDAATREQQLRGAFLEPRDAFFVPSLQIDKCFVARLPERQVPKNGHLYVISWDPSAATDPTACVVLDVTHKPWIGVDIEYWARPMGEPILMQSIHEKHAYWNGGSTSRLRGELPPRAITVWDGTSMGGAMITQGLADLTPRHIIQLAGQGVKLKMLTNLRAALNSFAIALPTAGEWTGLRSEVLTYKMPDDKIKQDRVMALLGAAEAAAKGLLGTDRMSFSPHGRARI